MDEFGKLLERARSGDAAALDLVYRRYAPKVARRVRDRMGGDLRRLYESQDVADSVFADVLRDLAVFEDRGERAFVHWLCLKAENKVRDKYRRHLGADGRRRNTTLDTAGAAAIEDGHTSAEVAQAAADEAARLLGRLPPLDAQIVGLRAAEQLPFSVIATRLALPSAEAARKRYARALLALRRDAAP